MTKISQFVQWIRADMNSHMYTTTVLDVLVPCDFVSDNTADKE